MIIDTYKRLEHTSVKKTRIRVPQRSSYFALSVCERAI